MPLPFKVAVVGSSFHQEAISLVNIGDEIEIRPDPLNPHDANARVVMSVKGPLGHLSRAIAERLAKEHPGVLHGVIVERLGKVTTGLRLNVTSEDEVAPSAPAEKAEAKPAVNVAFETGAAVVTVRSSGRVLGRLVREDLEGVHVLLDDGGEVVVDQEVVEISSYVPEAEAALAEPVVGASNFDID